MHESLIEPMGSVIKTIRVFYGANSGGLDYGLFGLEFLDKANSSILVAGDVSTSLKIKEICLADDERVVGVKSRLNRGFLAYH
jgi:hypothetical protein